MTQSAERSKNAASGETTTPRTPSPTLSPTSYRPPWLRSLQHRPLAFAPSWSRIPLTPPTTISEPSGCPPYSSCLPCIYRPTQVRTSLAGHRVDFAAPHYTDGIPGCCILRCKSIRRCLPQLRTLAFAKSQYPPRAHAYTRPHPAWPRHLPPMNCAPLLPPPAPARPTHFAGTTPTRTACPHSPSRPSSLPHRQHSSTLSHSLVVYVHLPPALTSARFHGTPYALLAPIFCALFRKNATPGAATVAPRLALQGRSSDRARLAIEPIFLLRGRRHALCTSIAGCSAGATESTQIILFLFSLAPFSRPRPPSFSCTVCVHIASSSLRPRITPHYAAGARCLLTPDIGTNLRRGSCSRDGLLNGAVAGDPLRATEELDLFQPLLATPPLSHAARARITQLPHARGLDEAWRRKWPLLATPSPDYFGISARATDPAPTAEMTCRCRCAVASFGLVAPAPAHPLVFTLRDEVFAMIFPHSAVIRHVSRSISALYPRALPAPLPYSQSAPLTQLVLLSCTN
ncbi:hypothetical protein HYPSUDRAFT_215544 [Hypholoma sublateritium FD-334 SS-4]|uniref:Uncharacterized protein n=1 Tax=Hypholoma sublateritium (strain FD-334 SS-4) TaxID=945553 RepID=A0A0D2PSS2_HYPSF|nr:hypothetical protein HYPSUDRAFT_215544 [Hypholoma sublateritium FD-334 SS-4]